MKIFLGGSKTLGALPQEAKDRLDGYIAAGYSFIIGDCHGADLAFQNYLLYRGVNNVTIYCSGSIPRYNSGGWRVVALGDTAHRGYEFYALKDIKMAGDADRALMLWNGRSRGTYNNIARIKSMGKQAEVIFIKK